VPKELIQKTADGERNAPEMGASIATMDLYIVSLVVDAQPKTAQSATLNHASLAIIVIINSALSHTSHAVGMLIVPS
jgi:hypothetical protein